MGVSNHIKRVVDTRDQGAADSIGIDPDLHNVRIQKSNILPIGPSGSGITHLVGLLASFLDIPLVIGDATSLTETGYVGDDVESLLSDRIIPVIEITARQAGEQGAKKAQITKRPVSPVISSGRSHLGAGRRAYQALLEGQVLRDSVPPRHQGRPLLGASGPARSPGGGRSASPPIRPNFCRCCPSRGGAVCR